MHPNRLIPIPVIVIVAVVLSATHLTCSDDNLQAPQDGSPGSAPDLSPPKNPRPTPVFDTMSSATPGVPSKVLTSTHTGWRQAGCLTTDGCHTYVHGGKSSASCAVCHGGNGASRLKVHAGHEQLSTAKSCGSCHAGVHAEESFADPTGCSICHKFEASNKGACPVTRDVDVVVIGAGGGGLAAAAGLARGGKEVVVIERHHKVGGYMTNFERRGYTFEVSLHGFDGLDPGGLNVDIFKKLGIWEKVKPVKKPVIYRVEYPGFTFEVPQDIAKYRLALQQRFPAESKGIDGIFSAADFIDKFMRAYTDYEAGKTKNPPPFLDLIKFQELSDLSLSKFLARHIKDPVLITLWTQLVGFAGTPPDKLSAGFFLIMWNSYHRHGYFNFIGGSQSVADALAQVVLENGGTIRLGTLGTKIAVADGKAVHVETEDDLCYRAKHVVSNASAPATIYQLIGADKVAKEDKDKYGKWKVGLSAFVVYLGVKRDYTKAFGSTHEIMISETFDPQKNFATVHECDVKRTPYALSNLTMLDPTTAPPGKNVIEITGQLSYDCGKAWSWSGGFDSYKAYKRKMAEALVRRAEKYLPGLSDVIEVMEVASPMTLSKFTLNPRGTIFGWDNLISQTMTRRMATTKLKGIENLFLAGAWAFPGGGQSAVIMSGANVADTILEAKP